MALGGRGSADVALVRARRVVMSSPLIPNGLVAVCEVVIFGCSCAGEAGDAMREYAGRWSRAPREAAPRY
jgi:hypothetical protein